MPKVRQLLEQKGTDVATIAGDCTALEAARMMNAKRIGSVVVLHDEHVAGIVTERDLMNRVIAEERNPAETKVADIMTANVACACQDTTLDELRQTMREKRIRHVPIINDERKLLGIVSIGDLNIVEHRIKEETIQYLEQYMYRP
ncbi:MAG: CBS domain-containing protein [Planctomycetes bacterium]|nr:CBS domain-containing protein [Planctomycetota bacterium]NOG55131.1 CBS domain-containing protein [Planctomycetota bacterium]